MENSDLPVSKQSEIRKKVVLNLRTGFKQQRHVNINDRKLNTKIAKTKACIKNNPDVVFTTSHKGNVTVCLQKTEYQEKMLKLLSDTNIYEIIKKNPLKKLQTNTSTILKNLNNNNYLRTKFNNNAVDADFELYF